MKIQGIFSGISFSIALINSSSSISLTAVPRGENAGRTLNHGPIVRHLRKLGRVVTTPFQLSIELPLEKSWHREQLSALVFLQSSGSNRILGAAQVSFSSRP